MALSRCGAAQVLKALGRLGKGSPATTEAISDILAKVAAAHASPPSKLGRAARSTSAAVAMETANTILEIAPVQMLRSYAVQIMANFLKQQDNNMRCVLGCACGTTGHLVALSRPSTDLCASQG